MDAFPLGSEQVIHLFPDRRRIRYKCSVLSNITLKLLMFFINGERECVSTDDIVRRGTVRSDRRGGSARRGV